MTEEKKEISSPPATPQPARQPVDEPRMRLHQLADELGRKPNRRLLVEYLRLRRTSR